MGLDNYPYHVEVYLRHLMIWGHTPIILVIVEASAVDVCSGRCRTT